MPHREIDNFEIWTGAAQFGDNVFRAMLETRPLEKSEEASFFVIKTGKKLISMEEAKLIAAAALSAVKSVNNDGVPSPLIDPTQNQARR